MSRPSAASPTPAPAAPVAVLGGFVVPPAGAGAAKGNVFNWDEMCRVTYFSRQDLESLVRQYQRLVSSSSGTSVSSAPSAGGASGGSFWLEKVDRTRFRDMLADAFEIDDSLLMDRVFRCFDADSDNYVNFEEFIRGMSLFLKGKFEEKAKFCFRVYDLNGDRFISKDEMYQMLKNSLVRAVDEDEDGVKELVEIALKKLDEDHDGRVSDADWSGAVNKETLLLEAFGKCLPAERAIQKFLAPPSGTHLPDDVTKRPVTVVPLQVAKRAVAAK